VFFSPIFAKQTIHVKISKIEFVFNAELVTVYVDGQLNMSVPFNYESAEHVCSFIDSFIQSSLFI
jgi:hypothetical protein